MADHIPGDALIDVLAGALADAGRVAVARGMVLGSGGNLSAREPGGDAFVITGTGTWLDRLTPNDFAVVGLDGVHRSGPRPSVEWQLHLQTYALRPDVNCVVHLHPQMAVLLDALGHEIRLITSDHALYVRKVARVPYLPAGSRELADAASEAARDCDAIVMAFHGCSTLGDSVEMGLRRALNLDEAANLTFKALLLGNTDLTFPPEWLDRLHSG